jgi:CRISPR system Cascade subunit CasD
MKILILKLEGPLVSFGDVAVDEIRPTAHHPFKSMIVGLLGNALGYRRTDPVSLERLQAGFSMASRIDRPARVMTDYQTVWIGADESSRPSFVKKGGWTSRPVHVRSSGDDTMQVYRDYLVDTSVTIALSFFEPELFEGVADKLKRPERPLFLGRKSCLPSRPVFEGVVEAGSLIEALQRYALTEGIDSKNKVACRTEAFEKSLIGGDCRQLSVRDIKNWANNYHSTNRQVVDCMIEVK